MPEYLRALVVILALATAVFAFFKIPVCEWATDSEDFNRRRNLWIGVTCVAFIAHNFWIYILVTAALLLRSMHKESNRLALFFFLLFAVPNLSNNIPGLGIINYFAELSYVRLLSLLILLPTYLTLRRQPGTEPFGQLLADKFIVGHLVLSAGLLFAAGTFTHTLRAGLVYEFLDIFLPYYVASRSLRNREQFRDALVAFALAALVLSAIGAFEAVRHWLLYSSLESALGVESGWTVYLERGGEGGTLRAIATAGHPIALGYVIAIAIALLLYLRQGAPKKAMRWNLGLVLLTIGILAPVSRGPWVGAAAMIIVMAASGPAPAKALAKLGMYGLAISPLILFTSAGGKLLALLPFIGEVDHTAEYRQRLISVSLNLILDSPFFGAYDYILSPEMQELKQGQGIIDVVNTYIAVGLGSGLIGLSIFAGFFLVVIAGVFRSMRKLTDRNGELYLLGQTLLAVLLGILVIIATVSSITIIPVVYWSMAGVGVSYACMLAREQVSEAAAAREGVKYKDVIILQSAPTH